MVESTTTPPPLQGPSAKEKKYDRQLRLWAASGQQALEEARILLLNSGPGVVGIEALKNLILPGAGNFTIVDSTEVGEEDLGVNFFLEEASLGKSRAEETCKYLQELNPEVKGTAIHKSIKEFIETPFILEKYSLIILVGPTRDSGILDSICRYAQTFSIPLFYIHSVGFYSHLSLQLPTQFPIVDTHPDPASTQDLRLLNPWPELLDFAKEKTANLHLQSDHEHGHVPYLLLLLHFLEIWKAAKDGEPPSDYLRKKEFKAMVEAGARRDNSEGGEENFDQAAAAVLKSLNPPLISNGLREVFDADDCKQLRADSASFWIIANAIHAFHVAHGVLPLPGALPDMKAQSSDYIQLQNIYKAKARSDVTEVTQVVRKLEQKLGIKSSIENKEIDAFCKGAQFIRLIHGRPIRVAKSTSNIDWDDRAKQFSQELQDPTSLLPIYFAFLALDRYQDEVYHQQQSREAFDTIKPSGGKRAPSGAQLPLPEFSRTAHFFTPAVDVENDPKPWPQFDTTEARAAFDDIVQELDRADGAELHNISALTGGMVAQEVIKVITKQYVPINNTCVFDGITSKTAVFDV